MRPYILAETNYAAVKQTAFEVAVIPLGATEPHNLHLPYGTDSFEATAIGERACAAAWSRGARVVLLPTVPYGNQNNMRGLPLAVNVNPSTLNLLLRDLVESLAESGIRKIVLLNSHGGNEFKGFVRETTGRLGAHLFLCNWFQMLSGDDYAAIFDRPDDHAGEMETSLALAYFPHCVARDEHGHLLADDGATRPLRFKALREGWVSTSREWRLLTANTGSGNPHAATADKGERLMAVVVERLGEFLAELAAAPIDAWFPFEGP